MKTWQYHITVHTNQEILDQLEQPGGDIPPTIFCDDEGACYFDTGPNHLTQAIERLLNQSGKEGWELVHVAFRPQQMICFWKHEAAEPYDL